MIRVEHDDWKLTPFLKFTVYEIRLFWLYLIAHVTFDIKNGATSAQRQIKQDNLRGLSFRANYTDWATAACWRS
jgi:hypothetical protein